MVMEGVGVGVGGRASMRDRHSCVTKTNSLFFCKKYDNNKNRNKQQQQRRRRQLEFVVKLMFFDDERLLEIGPSLFRLPSLHNLALSFSFLWNGSGGEGKGKGTEGRAAGFHISLAFHVSFILPFPFIPALWSPRLDAPIGLISVGTIWSYCLLRVSLVYQKQHRYTK